eukprot:211213_1
MAQWIINDIKFKQYLQQTMTIFVESSLSGEQILSLPINNIQRILEKELLSFVTKKTFNIMMRKIKYWKTIDDDNINTQTAEQIGCMVYIYPLIKLITRVNNKNDFISGAKFIDYYQQKKQWIRNVTGWNETDIFQLESALFKHNSFATAELVQKMDAILIKRLGETLGTEIKRCICVDHNVEEINYKMTNGGDMLQNFTDAIFDTVDRLMQQNTESKDNNILVKKIYESISDCFSFTDRLELLSQYNLASNQAWICCNCSSYNFHYYIGGKINIDLSICALCGVKQRDSIHMKLKNY